MPKYDILAILSYAVWCQVAFELSLLPVRFDLDKQWNLDTQWNFSIVAPSHREVFREGFGHRRSRVYRVELGSPA